MCYDRRAYYGYPIGVDGRISKRVTTIMCDDDEETLDQECLICVPVPLGMDDPTDEKPCQREEETKPPRLAEFRQTLEDYARELRAIINKFRRKLN